MYERVSRAIDRKENLNDEATRQAVKHVPRELACRSVGHARRWVFPAAPVAIARKRSTPQQFELPAPLGVRGTPVVQRLFLKIHPNRSPDQTVENASYGRDLSWTAPLSGKCTTFATDGTASNTASCGFCSKWRCPIRHLAIATPGPTGRQHLSRERSSPNWLRPNRPPPRAPALIASFDHMMVVSPVCSDAARGAFRDRDVGMCHTGASIDVCTSNERSVEPWPCKSGLLLSAARLLNMQTSIVSDVR